MDGKAFEPKYAAARDANAIYKQTVTITVAAKTRMAWRFVRSGWTKGEKRMNGNGVGIRERV